MRTLATRARAINQYNGLGNQLWDLAGNRPSLDLRFADEKSLVDATTGTNLVNHTRATKGTYVGSDGLIKTATTNYLTYSEEFDQATTDWFQGDATINSNAITAPDSSNTADRLIATGGATEHHVRKEFSATAGTTYTFSCFLKAAERSTFELAFRVAGIWPSGQNQVIEFTLTGSGSYSVTSGSPTGDIIALGNGWYRCHITATAVVTGTPQARVQDSYDADGEGIYLWGAQLEQSSTVGEYIPTTSTINSAPRFDHDPTTGESLGLLVEESRTNLVVQSQALTTQPSPWGDSAATTSLASTITDVFGGTSASFKLTEDNTNSSHHVSQAFTLAASTSYSVTAWFKQGSANRDGRILLTNVAAWDGSAAPRARIEFSTGTLQNVLGFTSTNLVPYSNGWYRFTGTALTSASGGVSGLRLLVSDGGETYQGDGTSFVYLGPCQLEEDSFPTSYIPTEGTTVTRSADVASISSANFSSWYNASEGTVFAHFDTQTWNSSTAFPKVFTLGNGSNENIWIGSDGTTDDVYRYRVRSGGVNYFGPANTARTKSSDNKAAIAVSSNSALSVDGAPAITASSVTVPSVTSLTIGADEGSSNNLHNNTIRRLTFWPIRLPNETLQTITN